MKDDDDKSLTDTCLARDGEPQPFTSNLVRYILRLLNVDCKARVALRTVARSKANARPTQSHPIMSLPSAGCLLVARQFSSEALEFPLGVL